MTLLLHHVACGAVGTPIRTSVFKVGVPPSICHLPPGWSLKGVSHGKCPKTLPSVIQAGGYVESQVRMAEMEPSVWGKAVRDK